MASDSALRDDIEAELEFEPSLDASGIGVAVNGGVATLTGHVPSYAAKVAAERAAGRVKGVRAVAEEIEVRLPSDLRHDDEEIAKRAANIITWSVYLPANAVHVKVEKGWVTLTGETEWQYQKQSAESGIRNLSGVIGVSNLIKVKPHVTAGDVRDRIAQAYRRNAELDSSGVKIAVAGNKVTLSGRVSTWRERWAAENAAWAVPGVTEVTDDLFIS
jgi:osmotically-inducible protein OsmY